MSILARPVAAFVMTSALALMAPAWTWGADQKSPQPAAVAVDEVRRGTAEPMAEFIGTIFYSRVSDLASEVAGKVAEVSYDEGNRVKKGQSLVRLSNEILEANLSGTRASYEQSLLELEQARRELARMEPLFQSKTISESLYDQHVFKVRGLEKKADSLKASLEKLTLQLQKTHITAGSSGIVLRRPVEPGEWIGEGGVVAVIADDEAVDAIVEVPSEVLEYLSTGRAVSVKAKGKTHKGNFTAFVPKGDLVTRTFAVKIRIKNTSGLMEGMEARASLPTGPRSTGLLVHRDAVITRMGRDVVFLAENGKARMLDVKVPGYDGMQAHIEAEGLAEGMLVVVKGNERINDGQAITITAPPQKPSTQSVK